MTRGIRSERVAVTAGLVDGATDQQLWSNSYERDINDVFALRKEVAKAIAREVRAMCDQFPVYPESLLD